CVVRILGDTEILNEARIVFCSRRDEVSPESQRRRIRIGSAKLRRIVDEIVNAVGFTTEFERVAAGDIRKVIYELEPAFIRQCVSFKKRCATERKIAAAVCVSLRRRRITDLEFEVAAPLKAELVYTPRSHRPGEARIV